MNIFNRYKKLFLVLGFLLLVALLAYLIWLVFFRSLSPAAPSIEDVISGGPLPIADSGTPGTLQPDSGPGFLPGSTAVTGPPGPNDPSLTATGGLTRTVTAVQGPVLDPTLSQNGQVQYYNQGDGRFYRLDQNGQAVALSDRIFHSVENVTWAPNKDKAILEYPDGNKILFNFNTQKQVTLPSHWQEFSFSPSSDQIVSKSMSPNRENRWLLVANDDGSQARILDNMGDNYDKVHASWSPNNQIVAMYTQGLDFNRQELLFVGLNQENFKSTTVDGRGFQGQWSSTGDRLLYSVYSTDNNLNPKLWVVDASSDTISQNRRGLNVNTWAEKCTFASNTVVYCAVPDFLERGAGLFPELADKTKDSLYKIDLSNNSQELVAVPDGTFNISQIVVSELNGLLYFTDKQSGALYQIRLR